MTCMWVWVKSYTFYQHTYCVCSKHQYMPMSITTFIYCYNFNQGTKLSSKKEYKSHTHTVLYIVSLFLWSASFLPSESFRKLRPPLSHREGSSQLHHRRTRGWSQLIDAHLWTWCDWLHHHSTYAGHQLHRDGVVYQWSWGEFGQSDRYSDCQHLTQQCICRFEW